MHMFSTQWCFGRVTWDAPLRGTWESTRMHPPPTNITGTSSLSVCQNKSRKKKITTIYFAPKTHFTLIIISLVYDIFTFMLSMVTSNIFFMSLMVAYTICGLSTASAWGVVQILRGATPAAMATSVAVHLSPPKQSASCFILYSTLLGPILTLGP